MELSSSTSTGSPGKVKKVKVQPHRGESAVSGKAKQRSIHKGARSTALNVLDDVDDGQSSTSNGAHESANVQWAAPAGKPKKERKKGITTQGAKAKGRNLQKAVRDRILKEFPQLTPEDVRSTSMGCGGMDVQLSTLAGNLFPFCVECKNVESLVLWKSLEQAEANTVEFNEIRSPKSESRYALLVFKKNGMDMFVCVQKAAMADALKHPTAAQLGLVQPQHYQESANVWAKIEAAVLKGRQEMIPLKLSTTKKQKMIMDAFTCTLARTGTPMYVVLSFNTFMRLLPLMTKPVDAEPSSNIPCAVDPVDSEESVDVEREEGIGNDPICID